MQTIDVSILCVEPGGQSVTFSFSAGQMSQVCIYQHCRWLQTQLIQSEIRVGTNLFFASWPIPKPHLSVPVESLPEESPKVISSPVSTTGLHLLVRTGPTQTHISECHVILYEMINWPLPVQIHYRCDRRPLGIMTRFLYPAER